MTCSLGLDNVSSGSRTIELLDGTGDHRGDHWTELDGPDDLLPYLVERTGQDVLISLEILTNWPTGGGGYLTSYLVVELGRYRIDIKIPPGEADILRWGVGDEICVCLLTFQFVKIRVCFVVVIDTCASSNCRILFASDDYLLVTTIHCSRALLPESSRSLRRGSYGP